MSEDFGSGVSRVLTPGQRSLDLVVWQDGQPPLDSELNLTGQISTEKAAEVLRTACPSGFLMDPLRARGDYTLDPSYSNYFVLGGGDEGSPSLQAIVNGWVVRIGGTYAPEDGVGDSGANRVLLSPPPTSGSRTDFVFLEVWKAVVTANPSAVNKPDAGHLYRWGNVEYGGASNPVDDLVDPAIGSATTARVQIQYRLRVVGGDGVAVDTFRYAEGLDDPQVLGQGASAAPVGGLTFDNMGEALGDPGLWRAGDGDPNNGLGTVDGYTYAIPVAAISRRNTGSFVAYSTSGSPNQNGAPDRNPSAPFAPNPRLAARTLTAATLGSALSETQTGYISILGLAGSGLDDVELFPTGVLRRYLRIGTEVVAFNVNPDPLGHPNEIFLDAAGRGRAGTSPTNHLAGTPVTLWSERPDGLFSDQIVEGDVLDMRHAVSPGDWDYGSLLMGAVGSVIYGTMTSTAKQAGTGGPSYGPEVYESALLQAPASIPGSTTFQTLRDGPDGVRTVWSDAAVVQGEVTVFADPAAPLNGDNTTATTFDVSVATQWSIAAPFSPDGFLNTGGGSTGWTNGSVIFPHIGGEDGAGGARGGLVAGSKSVRFLSPKEMHLSGDESDTGLKTPWRLRFLGGATGSSSAGIGTPDRQGFRAGMVTDVPTPGAGAMYPAASTRFERPFVVLGDVVHPTLALTIPAATANLIIGPPVEIRTISQDFDNWTATLGPDAETLRDLLTDGGRDFTGRSSNLYLVTYGDPDSRDNNGAFRVIGAGTAAAVGGAYTTNVATTADAVVVEPLSADWAAFDDDPLRTLTLEFRTMKISADYDTGRTGGPSGVAVVFTDLMATGLPWFDDVLAPLQDDGAIPPRLIPVASKLTLTTQVLWGPGRGATARVPGSFAGVRAVAPAATMVRNAPASLDPVWATDTGFPSTSVPFDGAPVKVWNRLPSLGLPAPAAPGYGGNVIGLAEISREAELFWDEGSKTAVYRPMTLKNLTLKQVEIPLSAVGPLTYSGGNPKDAAGIWTAGLTGVYSLPPEVTPRFGRQDIPYHVRTGVTDPILPGINHLFADSTDPTAVGFYVIGGENNPGPPNTNLVQPILFTTSGAIPYTEGGTLGGAPHSAYGARKCNYLDVVSSDLGAGLRGIELPPYHGVARLYGVYELADFLAHLDPTYIGAFQADRITPIVNPPTNLLRTDANKQTLFIRENGADDYANSVGNHTYIVPDTALDLTLIPSYVDGDAFDAFDYVVECEVFGFGTNFINGNTYILARRSSGSAIAVTDSDSQELIGVGTIVPAAAPLGDALSVGYRRTVYQGDPYGTRGLTSEIRTDYATRLGPVPPASAFLTGTPIEQYDSLTGAFQVQTPNPRAFEVLAFADIFTTLGTGKVSGPMLAGTLQDCGCIDPAAGVTLRLPSTSIALPFPLTPRVFTRGQGSRARYASLRFTVLDFAQITTDAVTMQFLGFANSAVPVPTGVDNEATATAIAAAVNSTASEYFLARAAGATVTLIARAPGAAGNSYGVAFRSTVPPPSGNPLTDAVRLDTLSPENVTTAYLSGGEDYPENGGSGDTNATPQGLSERLPLGIRVSDSDLLSESPDGGTGSLVVGQPSRFGASYQALPLAPSGREYSTTSGEPGVVVALSDGNPLAYAPYSGASPSGSRVFRLYRGGGATYQISGAEPGGPLSWTSLTFPASVRPVLKGAALAARFLLVRNFQETAFSGARVTSWGSELQLLVLTNAVYGTPTTARDGLVAAGVVGPAGWGEGTAAADRYRINGRPLVRPGTPNPPPLDIQVAPFFRP